MLGGVISVNHNRDAGLKRRDEPWPHLFDSVEAQRFDATCHEGAAPEAHRILAHPEGLGDLATGPARHVSKIARARSASPRSRERLRAISADRFSSSAETGDLPAMIPISNPIKRRNHSPYPLASLGTPA